MEIKSRINKKLPCARQRQRRKGTNGNENYWPVYVLLWCAHHYCAFFICRNHFFVLLLLLPFANHPVTQSGSQQVNRCASPLILNAAIIPCHLTFVFSLSHLFGAFFSHFFSAFHVSRFRNQNDNRLPQYPTSNCSATPTITLSSRKTKSIHLFTSFIACH